MIKYYKNTNVYFHKKIIDVLLMYYWCIIDVLLFIFIMILFIIKKNDGKILL